MGFGIGVDETEYPVEHLIGLAYDPTQPRFSTLPSSTIGNIIDNTGRQLEYNELVENRLAPSVSGKKSRPAWIRNPSKTKGHLEAAVKAALSGCWMTIQI